jgi:uncharacterized protein YcfJ
VGDKVEGGGDSQVKNVQHCSMQNFYENRPVAYNVVYEFVGKQYSVQMPTDPGPTIYLQITPMASNPQMTRSLRHPTELYPASPQQ